MIFLQYSAGFFSTVISRIYFIIYTHVSDSQHGLLHSIIYIWTIHRNLMQCIFNGAPILLSNIF